MALKNRLLALSHGYRRREQAEQLIARRRLTEAAAAACRGLSRRRRCPGFAQAPLRWSLCAVGRRPKSRGGVAPQLLASRTAVAVASHFESLGGEPASHDYLNGCGHALVGSGCRGNLRPLPERARSRDCREALSFRRRRARTVGTPRRPLRRPRDCAKCA